MGARPIAVEVPSSPKPPGTLAGSGLPPLKWSSLKYGFDHGGEEDWLGSGIVLKRQLGSYGRLPSAECLALEAYLGYFYLAETTNKILSSLFGKHELVRLLYQSIQL